MLEKILEPITGQLTEAELREVLELASDDIRKNRINSPIQNHPAPPKRTTLADLKQIVKTCVILLGAMKKATQQEVA